MSKLLEIQSEIAKLQKQASEIRTKEFAQTVVDIKAKMQAFGITIKDLQTTLPGRKSKKLAAVESSEKKTKTKKEKSPASTKVAAKYRGPNGEEWTGRGLTPKWLKLHIDAGKMKEDFAINPSQEPYNP
ncbi:MAG: H-NS histone family protein [Rhodoferax sp.]|nr:H-NS histone family protein [Rhodoferax sp.]MCF8208610.1 H-NS histone family protein [Rhodoferax sp.]